MKIANIYLAIGILFLLPVLSTQAQIVPDGSTSTTVTNNGNVSTIEAGDRAGSNLFHSFSAFSVTNGNQAFFNNAADIETIFSRVTGGNISNINGLIRANNVNLFLINPAGVIFGNGASLDIGGAFYGGTADSILFPNEIEFNANDTTAPILTINAPIGLSFRDEPGEVAIQGGINVAGGQDLTLLGGDLVVDSATINTAGGKVSLGAIAEAGTVGINGLDLDFSGVSLADIALDNGATINVAGGDGGLIEVNSRNLTLSQGSIFNAGINAEDSTVDSQAGDITINATETVALESDSVIRNNLSSDRFGNAGNILITAQNLSIADNSRISSISQGNGNAGGITLNIAENTILNGIAEIKSEISPSGEGDAGNIQIDSGSISLSNNSQLLADVKGVGNGGDIVVTTDTLNLQEQSNFSSNLSGVGSAGSIDIQVSDSIVLEGSTFQTRVLPAGEGSAGNINIEAGSIAVSEDISNRSSKILASTEGRGDAGDINITATTAVSLDNDSSIQTQVESSGTGSAGNITINTTDLLLTEGTEADRTSLLANSEGEGNSGEIIINARGNVVLDRFGLILSQGTANTGDAGDISITSDILSLNTGSVILSTTGDAENLDVSNAGDAGDISISSRITTLENFSAISSSSFSNSTGQAGNVTLNTDSLTLAGSGINALTENNLDGGTIEVNASDIDFINGGKIVTLTNAEGNAGNINLNLDRQLNINGENPLIPTEEFRSPVVVIQQLEPETGLFANTTTVSSGNGGNITIATPEVISVFNGGQIAVDSEGSGNGGNLTISAGDLNLNSKSQLIAETEIGQTDQRPSNIDLDIENIVSLDGDSKISAEASNNANGGNVTIDTEFVIAFPAEVEGNDIIASANEGAGGRINITAQEIFGITEGKANLDNKTNDLDVTSDFGFDGNISINTPDVTSATELGDLPANAIAPDETVQKACANNSNSINSLSLQGRGGVPTNPASTLSSNNILSDGQFLQTNQTKSDSGIMTAQGKIYPAQGVLVNAAGEIILTRSANHRLGSSDTAAKCLAN